MSRGAGNHRRTVLGLLAIVVVMGVMGWVSVPFYGWFGRVTGYGGAPSETGAGSTRILERTIKVRFETTKKRDKAWQFRPVQRQIELRIGETALVYFEAYNPTDRAVAIKAGYNVAPYNTGGYFKKIDCFCFQTQVLQPGERVMAPVSFYVDPGIVEDREARYVKSITLSYTLYETELPQAALSLSNAAANPLN